MASASVLLAVVAALGPFLWTALASALVVVAIVVGLRSRRPEERGPQEGPRAADPASSDLAALTPSAPVLEAADGVPRPVEGGEEEGPLLPRIPVDSTEWMEGEVLETDGAAPERPLRSVADLLEVLRTGEPRACHEAVHDLVRHGAAAVPELEAVVRAGDPDVRVDAARALALIRGETD